MPTAFIRAQFADPTIPWPERGSAEKELCYKEGWERRIIQTTSQGEPTTIEAMCKGSLAVNLMLGEDEGFAISLADSGWRISYNGSVFAKCADAMAAAESMMMQCEDWRSVQFVGFTAQHKVALKTIIEDAEKRGEILLDRVYPS